MFEPRIPMLGTLIPTPAEPLALAGALLSLAAFALLVFLWRDCVRRACRFPALPVGRRRVPSRWVGRAWFTLLGLAFLLGLQGLPVASTSRSLAAPPPAAGTEAPDGADDPVGVEPARATALSLRLPFWSREIHREETATGRPLEGGLLDTLQLPWVFLLAAGLYGLLGVRGSRSVNGMEPTSPANGPKPKSSGSGGAPVGGGSRGRPSGPGGGAARWACAALLPLAATLALLPAPRRADASGCGGSDGPLCYVYEDCRRVFLIIEKCTTTYAYYPDWV